MSGRRHAPCRAAWSCIRPRPSPGPPRRSSPRPSRRRSRRAGVAHWATTGGSAAPGIYAALATPPLRDAVDWSRVHTWWGDDRFVPYDDPLSNVLPLGDPAARRRDPGREPPPWPIPEAIARRRGTGLGRRPVREELAAPCRPTPRDAGLRPRASWASAPTDTSCRCSRDPRSGTRRRRACAVPAPTHVEPHVERVTIHPRVAGRGALGAGRGDRRVQGATIWGVHGPATTCASSRCARPASGRRPGSWTRRPPRSCRRADHGARRRAGQGGSRTTRRSPGAPAGRAGRRTYALRSASVGGTLAARIAGYRPATAPTIAVAPTPIAIAERRDHDGPPLARGVRAADQPSRPSPPAAPPSAASSSASPKNWPPIAPRVAPSARRRPISAPPLQHRHQHHVGDAQRADGERHEPEAQEQRRERGRRRGPRLDGVGRAAAR